MGNPAWECSFPTTEVCFLSEGDFDHTPILVQFLEPAKRAKPFKFLNHWGKHSEFMEAIRAAWHTNLLGSSTQFDQKLRLIKEACKATFKNTEVRDLAKAEADMQKVQEDLHLHPGGKHLADVECSKIEAYRRLKREWEAGLRQKAKLKWLTLGDDNTRYFHHSLQHRRKCNTINILHLQDRTTSDPQAAFQKYYLDLLRGKMKERARINMNVLHSGPVLNQDQQNLLDLNFTPNEIKDAMWSILEDKAPGVDGFNSGFYKGAWDIVGIDVVKAIQNFFANGSLLKSWNTLAITLIPKVATPNTPSDYRPISCCNVIYKCISKLICRKLQHVLAFIISPMHGAFIEGKNIIHNILCQDIAKHYGWKNCSLVAS